MSLYFNAEESYGPVISKYLSNSRSLRVLASICPYSFISNRPFLTEYIPWVSTTFGEVGIWTGDFFEYHNMTVFEWRTVEEAQQKAIQKSRKSQKLIQSIIEQESLET